MNKIHKSTDLTNGNIEVSKSMKQVQNDKDKCYQFM